MKTKIYLLLAVIILAVTLIACGSNEQVEIGFDPAPTVVAGETPGSLVLNAQRKNNTGTIYWVIASNSTTNMTAEAVIAANGAIQDGSADELVDHTVTGLQNNTEFAVFFVVNDQDRNSNVIRVTQRTAGVPGPTPTTPNFALVSIVPATGVDGGLLFNVTTNGVGVIHYIITARGVTTPTAAQVIAGVDYGDVAVVRAGNAAAFVNVEVTGLTPGGEYTVFLVVTDGTNNTPVRSSNVVAYQEIELVDKGEGTAENPFRIATAQDLEAIGQGFNPTDGREWTMNCYYELVANIDLRPYFGPNLRNWPVLGDDSISFHGNFEGNGYSIIGLFIGSDSTAGLNRGLFSNLGPYAVVQNVTFISASIHGNPGGSGNRSTGIVTGRLRGTVNNVSIVTSEVVSLQERVGGIAGWMGDTGSITNVYVNARLRGTDRVGGIVGNVDSSATTTEAMLIENVIFEGTVFATNRGGGIVGWARTVDINNAIVLGYIQGVVVGGIAGFYQRRTDGIVREVTQTISNSVVYANVVGLSGGLQGQIVGDARLASSDLEIPAFENNFFVDGGSVVLGQSNPNASVMNADGTLTLTEFADEEWFRSNIVTMNFDNVFTILADAQRPSLVGTPDLGLLPDIDPLQVIADVTAGSVEGSLDINITANKEGTIYYVIVAAESNLTVNEIQNPAEVTGVLFFGSGAYIDVTHMMPAFATTYFVYWVFEGSDGSIETGVEVGTSAAMELLIISGGLRPGANAGEIILNLSTNLVANIHWVLVDQEGNWDQDTLLNPNLANVVDSGSATVVENLVIGGLRPGENYWVYAIAIASDRESVVFINTSHALDAGEINLGEGTEANPFIINSVNSFMAIGRGVTNVNGVEQNFTLNAHYLLTANIDLTATLTGGTTFEPIENFGGVIDGGNFTVTGLYINSSDSANHAIGFVRQLTGNGIIRNITFENAVVTVTGLNGNVAWTNNNNAVGIVAGRSEGTIENVNIINGTVDSERERTGALIGVSATNGTLTNIFVTANVSAPGRVGGIAGLFGADSGNFVATNLVFIGTVTATNTVPNGSNGNRAGGLFGIIRGATITNAIFDGCVYGNSNQNQPTGAVIGQVEGVVGLENHITNVIANAVVTVNAGAYGLIGAVTEVARPLITVNGLFRTIGTTGASASNFPEWRLGELLPATLTQEWVIENLPGLLESEFWTFDGTTDRPRLVGTPDTGLFNVI